MSVKPKVVYQLNRAGVFVGTTLADPSPMEPGVFLIPAGCVEQAPPEHIDGLVRVWRGNLWSYVNKALEPKEADTPLPTLPEIKAALAGDVDDQVAAIYSRWTRFQMAYQEREAAAIAFRAANYEGDPGEWITKFAEPAKLTLREAADRVLLQAAGMREALKLLDAQRMRKYEILGAVDQVTATAAHASILAEAGKIAAMIP